MFGQKKNKLPPRPCLPSSKEILADLNNAKVNDVAFSIMPKDNILLADLHFSINVNDADNIYDKARRYLHNIHKLEILDKILNMKKENLKIHYDETIKLAREIQNQA